MISLILMLTLLFFFGKISVTDLITPYMRYCFFLQPGFHNYDHHDRSITEKRFNDCSDHMKTTLQPLHLS